MDSVIVVLMRVASCGCIFGVVRNRIGFNRSLRFRRKCVVGSVGMASVETSERLISPILGCCRQLSVGRMMRLAGPHMGHHPLLKLLSVNSDFCVFYIELQALPESEQQKRIERNPTVKPDVTTRY